MSNIQRYAVAVEYQIVADCEIDIDMDEFAEFLADNPGASMGDYIKEEVSEGYLSLPNPEMGELWDFFIDAEPMVSTPTINPSYL